jgi:hypothetical protein
MTALAEMLKHLVSRNAASPREKTAIRAKFRSSLRHCQKYFLKDIVCRRSIRKQSEYETTHGRGVLQKQLLNQFSRRRHFHQSY